MSSPKTHTEAPPLDLTRWRNVPNLLVASGAVLALLGLVVNPTQFAHSWLLGFMFCLSLALGALFLVMVHHLFDAGWSVPIRRFCEHIANLVFPWLAAFFVPVALFAPKLYHWMQVEDPHADHALHAKFPLFTWPGFYLISIACFAVWWWLAKNLRAASLEQDRTGAAACTHRMRRYAAGGIVLFAITLTLAAILWMKGMMYHWFSTMYGVYYFAGSVWMTLGTVYVITMVLKRNGTLTKVLHEHQFYYIGSLLFAFTVFYAYIHFSQYFIIWNANIPEETFWYVLREKGTWWYVGMILIFGHFFLPFLALLRIDLKLTFWWMTPICIWTWLMHYFDLSFNIMPSLHPEGFPIWWVWVDLGCLALMVGLLARAFLAAFQQHAPYPVQDPRLCEAMGLLAPCASPISGGDMDETEELADAMPETTGGAK
ncbi:MAG: hypothetical protein H7A45_17355 [Verrucomicrobiales bacterium]|nr:hypothetical protein [Verrucomicrobiales bacterium]MCP5525581.1 hypothetical protein [Verrucomicrobiales bacterium]